MPKESLLSSMPKLILAVVLIVCIGAVMGLMGYALTKQRIPSQSTPTQKEISAIGISADKKSIVDVETKEVIFTIEEAEKFLQDSGYEYNSETFQDTNAKYAGNCFGNATLSNDRRKIVFSTGCLAGDLPQTWIGVYEWWFTCQKLNSWQCDPNDPTAPALEGFNTFHKRPHFLIGGSGRDFIWSSDNRTITYKADLGLSGMTETRIIDAGTGEILKRGNEIITKNWQAYRNKKYGYEVIFNEEYKNIWGSKYYPNSGTNSRSLARTDFYFIDYPIHIFSTIAVYEKEWFIENSEKRMQYKEWSAKNNGTIEEYNKIRDEMKSEFIRKKGETAWLKGDGNGYPMGTYLGENNDYVFVLGIGPNGCMATESLCSLPMREIIMNSFQIIDTDSDWQTYRNEEFGFEVKYPEEWKINEAEIIYGQNKGYEINFLESERFYGVGIKIFKINQGETDKEFFNRINKVDLINITKDKKTIAGIEAEYYKNMPSHSSYDEAFFVYDNHFYGIARYAVEEDIFDQILSTFKFIEK